MVLGVLVAILLGVATSLPSAVAGAAVAPSVTVTPATNLTDGQQLTINVKADASLPVFQVEGRVCRAGVDYQPSTGNRPAPDFEVGGPNCPPLPLSSSADVGVVDSTAFPSSISPGGASTTIRVGTGLVNWTTPGGGPVSLQCDESHPCVLVVQVKTSASGVVSWTPFVQPLSYLPSDPIAGCGGPAPGILATGGSDRMSDAWVSWTLQGCRRPGQSGAPTRGLFAGEGEAMLAFDSGQLDLAYTAAGYDPAVGFVPPGAIPPRASVPVPIGLNAVVVAVAGGRVGSNGRTVPYQDIRLTLPEVAALLSGGAQGIEPHQDAIFARNPELAQTGLFANNVFQVGATSTAEAPHWFATKLLDEREPSSWVVPDAAYFAPEQGRPRGVDASLALASPSFSQALNLFTGRPSLRKNLIGVSAPGGAWVLTDLETARSMGMTVVKVELAPGAFVAPTPENMAAAVPTMTRNAQGMLLPTLPPTTGTDADQAYPWTFVEYALAPSEQLVDLATCTLRSGSQALLGDWLQYITGAGQAALPGGMVPLPGDLAVEAAAAIPKVGATAHTGPCVEALAAANQPPPAPVAPPAGELGSFPAPLSVASFGDDLGPGAVDLATSSFGGGGGLSADLIDGPSETAGAVTSTTAPPVLASTAVPIPDFAGSRLSSRMLTVVSFLVIVGLTSAAALVSAGRRPRFGERRS